MTRALAMAGALLMMSAAPAPWVLSPDGLGPLKIGMSEAQAAAALGAKLSAADLPDDACEERGVVGMKGLVLMFQQHRLTRISLVRGSRFKTDKGLGYGATETQVRAAYGAALKTEPNAYDDEPALYLTWWSKPGRRGIRYSTDAHRVVQGVDAGDDSIRYIEGCL